MAWRRLGSAATPPNRSKRVPNRADLYLDIVARMLQVQFLKGWFSDTLPTVSIDKPAVLRLDGDRYASTIDALDRLCEKVSPGGYPIVDDYGAVPARIKNWRKC